jgi:hypothetical protein
LVKFNTEALGLASIYKPERVDGYGKVTVDDIGEFKITF